MAKIIKEDYVLGATIDDIDLRQPLDEELRDFIFKALAEYEVIFLEIKILHLTNIGLLL